MCFTHCVYIFARLNQEKGFCEIDERLWKSYAYIHICLSHCTCTYSGVRELRARLCRVNFEILRKTIKLRSLYMKHFISVPHDVCVWRRTMCSNIYIYMIMHIYREIVTKQRTMGFWLAWEKWSLEYGIQQTLLYIAFCHVLSRYYICLRLCTFLERRTSKFR